jgi:hypothetical protein
LADHEVGQGDAISPGGLHTNQRLIVDKKGKQPTDEVGKALIIVSERFMFGVPSLRLATSNFFLAISTPMTIWDI